MRCAPPSSQSGGYDDDQCGAPGDDLETPPALLASAGGSGGSGFGGVIGHGSPSSHGRDSKGHHDQRANMGK